MKISGYKTNTILSFAVDGEGTKKTPYVVHSTVLTSNGLEGPIVFESPGLLSTWKSLTNRDSVFRIEKKNFIQYVDELNQTWTIRAGVYSTKKLGVFSRKLVESKMNLCECEETGECLIVSLDIEPEVLIENYNHYKGEVFPDLSLD